MKHIVGRCCLMPVLLVGAPPTSRSSTSPANASSIPGHRHTRARQGQGCLEVSAQSHGRSAARIRVVSWRVL